MYIFQYLCGVLRIVKVGAVSIGGAAVVPVGFSSLFAGGQAFFPGVSWAIRRRCGGRSHLLTA